jgi:hypothetical protein
MKAKIVFQDGSWFIGRRVNLWEQFIMPETPNTYHWIVLDVGYMNVGPRQIDKGDRIAVPISSMKYCVFARDFYEDGTTKSKELPF